jgi:argininosuccinate lyase
MTSIAPRLAQRSLAALRRVPLPAVCGGALPAGATRRAASPTPAASRTMSASGISSVSSVGFRLSRSGRFSGETDPLMEQFNASLPYDKRMWREDIQGSIAYAGALGRAGLLKPEEVKTLQDGLRLVHKEWEAGTFETKAGDEDIHTANERRLTELVGPVGGKLHTGRSRNDQVVTDVRLWLRHEITELIGNMKALIQTAVDRAEKEMDLILPGYTHLQRAQPVRWSHWMLCYASQWRRDVERLENILTRVNVMPLGVGALSGHPFNIDRAALAKDLGFDGVIPNSLDAVGDRDFILDFLFGSSMIMVHMSRFAEDLILYSSTEFGFVKLADAYSTGSSLMPQKKNPDALELLRGKSGRTIGQLVGLLVTVKGTPSTYNKDLQEDKEPLFDAADTLSACSQIANGVLSTLTPVPEKMRAVRPCFGAPRSCACTCAYGVLRCPRGMGSDTRCMQGLGFRACATPGICHGPLSPSHGKGSRQIFFGEDDLLDRSGLTHPSGCCRQTPSYILKLKPAQHSPTPSTHSAPTLLCATFFHTGFRTGSIWTFRRHVVTLTLTRFLPTPSPPTLTHPCPFAAYSFRQAGAGLAHAFD